MKVVATPTFERAAKKLHARDRKVLDEAVREILAAPDVGVAKKGDLAGVFVHKFKLNKQETLLSYQFSASTIVLLSIGSHENFYRDLKR
ncbi:type II toxin-antitoxin system RelE/ParE family toxin [Caballeronia pedi]|nr:type II toxin-antitoxin system RelE/ParE family toxin [Caballeronia pedi]